MSLEQGTFDELMQYGLVEAVVMFWRRHETFPERDFTLEEWRILDSSKRLEAEGVNTDKLAEKMVKMIRQAARDGRRHTMASTFQDWGEVEFLTLMSDNRDIKKFATGQLVELVTSYEEWDPDGEEGLLTALDSCGDDAEVMRQAVQKLSQSDFTLEQWVNFARCWCTSGKPHPIEAVALMKITEKAKSKTDWEAALAAANKDLEDLGGPSKKLLSLIKQQLDNLK